MSTQLQNYDEAVWIEPEPPKPGTIRMRRWRQRNRIRALVQSQVAVARTRARRRGLKATLTFAVWWSLLEFYGWKCLACGVVCEVLHLDHIKPQSRRGHTTKENVQPLCGWCNKSKGKKTIDYRKENVCQNT